EGATFLVLEPFDAAEERGAHVLGEVTGWGWRALNAAPCGVGGVEEPRAITLALARAGVAPAAVSWAYDSATLDRARDDWEQRVLDVALPHRPPRRSLGHWLGRHSGLGALRVASAAWTADRGRLPAIGDGTSVDRGPGLVHGVARGGTHVAVVVQAARIAPEEPSSRSASGFAGAHSSWTPSSAERSMLSRTLPSVGGVGGHAGASARPSGPLT